MKKLENTDTDRLTLLKAVNDCGKDTDAVFVWFFKVTDKLAENKLELGDYFHKGGEDNVLRRVNLAIGKAQKDLTLSIMKKHKMTKKQAEDKLEAVLSNLKPIRIVPDFDGKDVDDILAGF